MQQERPLLFIVKEEEPKKQEDKSIQTFRQKNCCMTELWKALYQKALMGQFLKNRDYQTEAFDLFPDFFKKNLSGKQTE